MPLIPGGGLPAVAGVVVVLLWDVAAPAIAAPPMAAPATAASHRESLFTLPNIACSFRLPGRVPGFDIHDRGAPWESRLGRLGKPCERGGWHSQPIHRLSHSRFTEDADKVTA